MTTTNPYRIFICPIIPEELVYKYPGTQAANTFCRHLIDGGVFDCVFSLPPTNLREDLSKFNKPLIEFICVARNHQCAPLKLFSAIAENWRVFKKIRKGSSVWFYNLGWNFLFLYWLLGLKGNIKRNVIVADFTPPRGVSLLSRVSQYLIRRANARIVLAHSDRFKSLKTVCIPGVVPEKNIREESALARDFFMSGFLTPKRAFPRILSWFSEHPNCKLTVSGFVPDREVLLSYVSTYSNIRDLGFLPYNEYVEALSTAGICLNTRDPALLENHENFPSKMIEYLLYNKVVISTMRYPQLEGIDYIYVPLEKATFMESLENVLKMPEKELIRYANQGKKLLEKFSPTRWKDEMLKLEK